MMRKTMTAAGMVAMLLAGCAKSGPPPKREPGSWSQKVELKRIEGKGAEQSKAGLEKMIAITNMLSICVTPEMAAKEDPTTNYEKLGGGAGGDCKFDRKSAAGGDLDIASTCKDADGKISKFTATGTLGASVQDVTVTIEGFDASGVKEARMEMAVHSTRNGECTAKDMKIPTGASAM